MKDEEKINREKILDLLSKGDLGTVKEILSSHHPADVARVMNGLSQDQCRDIFYLLPPKMASEIIVELSDEMREYILEDMESKRVSEIVDHMASDDAADLLGALPEDEANKVLELIHDEETRHVKSLLAFDEDTAGGIMQTEVAAVRSSATVQEIISMLREKRDVMDDVHNIFVVDDDNKLIGILPVRRLVLEDPAVRVTDIMDTDFVATHIDQDQEEIARLFKKYDLISIPVLDDYNRLVGRITIDDIVDVMEEEASEDFFKMAGAGADDILPMSTVKSARTRLPWLFASCIGGIVAMKIIGAFESTLGRYVAIASFIPVILGMGGNIGTQSTTLIVRGLATGSVEIGELWRVVFKEIRVGLTLGVIYGSFLSAATLFIYPGSYQLSIVVGLSMCASMVFASALGTMVPILLYKMGVDPAVATGPFVTTSVDIIGILILFNFATIFLF